MDEKKLPSLTELNKKIEAAKQQQEPQKKEDAAFANGLGYMSRVLVELFGGIIVGGFLGYGLDHWLDSFPAFFLVCLILGLAGSMLNIYKMVTKSN